MRTVLLLSLIIVTIFISTGSHAFSTVNVACPVKFKGKVTGLKEQFSTFFPKNEVTFDVEENIKGDSPNIIKISVVKDGPVKFEKGKEFFVELNNGYICKAEEII